MTIKKHRHYGAAEILGIGGSAAMGLWGLSSGLPAQAVVGASFGLSSGYVAGYGIDRAREWWLRKHKRILDKRWK